LIHWNEAEGRERASRLRQAGHDVRVHSDSRGAGLRNAREEPPDVVVIDLSRSPSTGRDAGVWFRGAKATRAVPIVFVGGEDATAARVRSLLPDATFTDWRRVRGALRKALQRPLASPASPGVMAGYSGTPLPKKLGIKPAVQVRLIDAPTGFERVLGALPPGARVSRRGRGAVRVVLLFCRNATALRKKFEAASRLVEPRGVLWIVWPKKTSALASDLDQAGVRAYGLGRAWVDYKICAVDETWSGLAFARRTLAPCARSSSRR
jgi:hypothetical protein